MVSGQMSYQQSCMKMKLSNKGAYKAFEKLGIMNCKCSSCTWGYTMGTFLRNAFSNSLKQNTFETLIKANDGVE